MTSASQESSTLTKINPDFGCAIIDAVWSEIGSALEPDYWLALEKGRRRLHKSAHWSLIEDKLRFLAHECVFVYGRLIMELAHTIDGRLPVADPSCWSRRQVTQLCHHIAGHYDARRLRPCCRLRPRRGRALPRAEPRRRKMNGLVMQARR